MSEPSLYDSILDTYPGHPVFNRLNPGFENRQSNLQSLKEYYRVDNHSTDGSYVNYVELDSSELPSIIRISLRPSWSTRDIVLSFEERDISYSDCVRYTYTYTCDDREVFSKVVEFNLSFGRNVFLRSYLGVIHSINRWYVEADLMYDEWVESGSFREEIKSVQNLISIKDFNPSTIFFEKNSFIINYCFLKGKKCKSDEKNPDLTLHEFSKYSTLFHILGDIDFSYEFSKCSDDVIGNLWSAAEEYRTLIILLRDSIISKYNLPEDTLSGVERALLSDLDHLNYETKFNLLRNFLK